MRSMMTTLGQSLGVRGERAWCANVSCVPTSVPFSPVLCRPCAIRPHPRPLSRKRERGEMMGGKLAGAAIWRDASRFVLFACIRVYSRPAFFVVFGVGRPSQ